jgi:hypothetical protein
MSRMVILGAAILALASVALGCGAGSESTAEEGKPSGDTATKEAVSEKTAPAVSKAKFIDAASRICKAREQEKFTLIGERFKQKQAEVPNYQPSNAYLEEIVVEVVVPVMRRLTKELAETNPPRTGAKKVEAMISAFESDIDKTEATPRKYLEGVAFKNGDDAAVNYGLFKCTF